MKLTSVVTQKIIKRLLTGDDYRVEVLTLINAQFLEFAIEFFKRVAEAKLNNKQVTEDWYKETLLHPSLSTNDLIINSGLNKKTITNSYGTARREVVLDVTLAHYEQLLSSINELIQSGEDIDIQLTIKFRSVSVDLNLSETLIVVNTLAVKRAQIRGGAWSTTGKQVEIPLMLTLCRLFSVAEEHYDVKGLTNENREVDFHLIGSSPDDKYQCEVKLMGRGNPESADAVIARDTDIFVADTLSELNKVQLTTRNVLWIALNTPQGYLKFGDILEQLHIPHEKPTEISEQTLDWIFLSIFE